VAGCLSVRLDCLLFFFSENAEKSSIPTRSKLNSLSLTGLHTLVDSQEVLRGAVLPPVSALLDRALLAW
jgi:hypothetical protein